MCDEINNIHDHSGLSVYLRMPVHENHDYKSIIEKLFDAGINAIAFSKDSNSFSPTFINLEQIIIKKQIPIIDDMPFSNPAEDYTFNKLHYSKSKLKYLKLFSNSELIIPGSTPISIGNLLLEPWDKLWTKCRQFSDG